MRTLSERALSEEGIHNYVTYSPHCCAANYLPNGGSVSYNGGGLDWAQGSQLLDSLGTGTAATAIAGNVCGNGIQQSPINIVDSPSNSLTSYTGTDMPPLLYNYPVQNQYLLEMNEHTLEVKFDLNNANNSAFGITSLTQGYLTASQLHFHSPSEHTLNGIHYPLELHIVNQVINVSNNFKGTLPGEVIAIMFAYSANNSPSPFVAQLLANTANFPSQLLFSQRINNSNYANKNNSVEYEVTSGQPLDLGALIAAADPTSYYRYTGTLTTPACSSVVVFNVLPTPLPISVGQVTAFTNLLAAAQGGISRGADNRPPNPVLSTTVIAMSKKVLLAKVATITASDPNSSNYKAAMIAFVVLFGVTVLFFIGYIAHSAHSAKSSAAPAKSGNEEMAAPKVDTAAPAAEAPSAV